MERSRCVKVKIYACVWDTATKARRTVAKPCCNSYGIIRWLARWVAEDNAGKVLRPDPFGQHWKEKPCKQMAVLNPEQRHKDKFGTGCSITMDLCHTLNYRWNRPMSTMHSFQRLSSSFFGGIQNSGFSTQFHFSMEVDWLSRGLAMLAEDLGAISSSCSLEVQERTNCDFFWIHTRNGWEGYAWCFALRKGNPV